MQEMIDICDFAVGLSRQLYGLTIATERGEHRMMETWHPLGVIGIISAFNFPVAVWSWNAALALVCGDSIVWKPSEKTPLTALATQALFERALTRFKEERRARRTDFRRSCSADARSAKRWSMMPRCRWCRRPARPRWAAPSARPREALCPRLLELGGNNAAIVAPTADLDLTLRGVAFAAMGTAGQRCTSLRRLFVHESVYDSFIPRLKAPMAPCGRRSAGARKSGRAADRRRASKRCRALWPKRKRRAALLPAANASVSKLLATRFMSARRWSRCRTDRPGRCEETFAPILYVMNMAISMR